jgi:hypothetical protein
VQLLQAIFSIEAYPEGFLERQLPVCRSQGAADLLPSQKNDLNAEALRNLKILS